MTKQNWIIADPSLDGLTGHHYNYSVAMARAASKAGFKTQVLGNRRFKAQTDDVILDPYFSSSIYGSLKPIYESRFRKFRRNILKLATELDPRTPHQIHLLKAPIRYIEALFRWVPWLFNKFIFGYPISTSLESVFACELNQVVHEYQLSPSDVIFIHTATPSTVQSIIEFAVKQNLEKMPHVHLLLRYDEGAMPEDQGYGVLEPIRKLRRLGILERKVFLYAETEALAARYAEAGVKVETLHNIANLSPLTESTDLIVSFLGDARSEKGFHHLPDLVEQFPNTRFIIQAYTHASHSEGNVQSALLRLRAMKNVQVLEDPLSEDEFKNLLNQSSIVLLPYSSVSYQRRGSGIFVDALAQGIPLLVSSGTWMATQLDTSSGLSFDGQKDFAKKLKQMIDLLPNFREAAQKNAASWRENHSGDALIEKVCARMANPAPQRPLVLHIAPLLLRQGATRVFESQLQYLEEMGYGALSVQLITDPTAVNSIDGMKKIARDNYLNIPSAYSWFLGFEKKFSNILSHRNLLRTGTAFLRDYRLRYFYQVPSSLDHFISKNKINAVVLNYAQNFPLIELLNLEKTPLILETIDIQSYQYALAENVDTEAEFKEELTILKKVRSLVTINQNEEKILSAVLPDHFIRTAYPFCQLREQHGSHSKPVDLLFMGSGHTSNIESLRWFRDQVFSKHLGDLDIRLTVAGSVCQFVENDLNLESRMDLLGEIRDASSLYRAAKLVLLPVIDGTGLPIKTLDTLSLKRPFVATSMALRGLPEEWINFPTCDSPAEFAKDIRDLLASDRLREERAEQGWQFAQKAMSKTAYFKVWDELFSRKQS